MRRGTRTVALVGLAAYWLLACIGVRATAVPITTQHNNLARTGANLQETILTAANVGPGTFGKLFSRAVDGQVYAQPLYVPGVTINGAVHNVLYVATQHNSLYAFDADTPYSEALWRKTFETPVHLSTTPPYGNPDCCGFRENYQDIKVEIGITSTPAINTATNTIYLVTMSEDSSTTPHTFSHHLHALDIRTGQERPFSPVLITGSVTGAGTSIGGCGCPDGTVVFASKQQIQRAAVTLHPNGLVYIAFGSFKDDFPYHGWIMAYDGGNLEQRFVYNTTADRNGGGIWMVGQGLAVDTDGSIFFMTGNGDHGQPCVSGGPCAENDGVQDGSAMSDSFVKLTPYLTVLDWFRPHDVLTYPNPFGGDPGYNELDLDLGSGGVVLIPGTNLLVGGGKTGDIFVMDKGNMGHYNAAGDTQIVQRFLAAQTPGFDLFRIYSSPVFWNNRLYVWPKHNPLVSFAFTPNGSGGGQFNTTPTTAPDTGNERESQAGGYLSISANGTTPGTGILWASHGICVVPNPCSDAGILHAYDASDITKELWNSDMNAARDHINYQAKFNPPLIANGKVYIPSFSDSTGSPSSPSNTLNVYGLLNTAMAYSGASAPSTVAGAAQSVTVTVQDINGQPVADYTGTIHFRSSDPLAILPADYTFSASEHGVHTFSVTLNTGGPQTLTVTQSDTSAITGTASIAVAPALTAVSPNAGGTAGGGLVTLSGLGFTPGATVTFDGIPATVTAVAGATITARVPAHAVGTVAVAVTTTGGTATLPNGYTYAAVDPLPGSRPSVPSQGQPAPVPSARAPVATAPGVPSPAPAGRP
jgi:hypothetical protein